MKDLTDQGLKDGRGSLADITRTLTTQISYAERTAGEAEAHLNNLKKLKGFVDMVDELYREEQKRREDALPR